MGSRDRFCTLLRAAGRGGVGPADVSELDRLSGLAEYSTFPQVRRACNQMSGYLRSGQPRANSNRRKQKHMNCTTVGLTTVMLVGFLVGHAVGKEHAPFIPAPPSRILAMVDAGTVTPALVALMDWDARLGRLTLKCAEPPSQIAAVVLEGYRTLAGRGSTRTVRQVGELIDASIPIDHRQVECKDAMDDVLTREERGSPQLLQDPTARLMAPWNSSNQQDE